MSGTGAGVAPRMQHAHLAFSAASPPNPTEAGWCPTNGCGPAVQAERAAAVEHVRRKIEVAKRHDGDGHLVRVLDELAEDLERGLHLA